jgi:hypothetical protein
MFMDRGKQLAQGNIIGENPGKGLKTNKRDSGI